MGARRKTLDKEQLNQNPKFVSMLLPKTLNTGHEKYGNMNPVPDPLSFRYAK